MTNKRLAKLAKEGFIHCHQNSPVEEKIYRVGATGRIFLLSKTNYPEESIVMTRKPPKEITHFVAINQIRLMLERAIERNGGEIKFFFTDAELRRRNLESTIIPDAITHFILNGERYFFAIEFDTGSETAQYFFKTKLKKYLQIFKHNRNLLGMTDFRVLILTHTSTTALKLNRAALKEENRLATFYIAPLDFVSDNILTADVFIDPFALTASTGFIQKHRIIDMVSQAGPARDHPHNRKLLQK